MSKLKFHYKLMQAITATQIEQADKTVKVQRTIHKLNVRAVLMANTTGSNKENLIQAHEQRITNPYRP